MKKIAMTVLVLALVAFSTFNVFLQEVPITDTQIIYLAPDKIPLSSLETLKAYALTMVGKISVQVYGNSVSGETYRFVEYPYTDADPEKMAAIAGAQTLRFKSTTDENLTAYVSYESKQIKYSDPNSPNDAGGSTTFTLFGGSKVFRLENKSGTWKVPEAAYNIELDMLHVPFVVPGMNNAYLQTTDENGNINGHYDFRSHQGNFWVERGVIFLTPELVSRRGTLTINMLDGTKAVYDLVSGNKKTMATVEAKGFRPTIKGVRTVPNNTADIVYKDTDEIIRTAYTTLMESSVSFPAGLKRYPTKVYVIYTTILAENPNAEWFEFNPYTEAVKFKIQVGQAILIRFEYPNEPQSIGWPQDGKG